MDGCCSKEKTKSKEVKVENFNISAVNDDVFIKKKAFDFKSSFSISIVKEVLRVDQDGYTAQTTWPSILTKSLNPYFILDPLNDRIVAIHTPKCSSVNETICWLRALSDILRGILEEANEEQEKKFMKLLDIEEEIQANEIPKTSSSLALSVSSSNSFRNSIEILNVKKLSSSKIMLLSSIIKKLYPVPSKIRNCYYEDISPFSFDANFEISKIKDEYIECSPLFYLCSLETRIQFNEELENFCMSANNFTKSEEVYDKIRINIDKYFWFYLLVIYGKSDVLKRIVAYESVLFKNRKKYLDKQKKSSSLAEKQKKIGKNKINQANIQPDSKLLISEKSNDKVDSANNGVSIQDESFQKKFELLDSVIAAKNKYLCPFTVSSEMKTIRIRLFDYNLFVRESITGNDLDFTLAFIMMCALIDPIEVDHDLKQILMKEIPKDKCKISDFYYSHKNESITSENLLNLITVAEHGIDTILSYNNFAVDVNAYFLILIKYLLISLKKVNYQIPNQSVNHVFLSERIAKVLKQQSIGKTIADKIKELCSKHIKEYKKVEQYFEPAKLIDKNVELSTQQLLKTAIKNGIEVTMVDIGDNFIKMDIPKNCIDAHSRTTTTTISTSLSGEKEDLKSLKTILTKTEENTDNIIDTSSIFEGAPELTHPNSISIFKYPNRENNNLQENQYSSPPFYKQNLKENQETKSKEEPYDLYNQEKNGLQEIYLEDFLESYSKQNFLEGIDEINQANDTDDHITKYIRFSTCLPNESYVAIRMSSNTVVVNNFLSKSGFLVSQILCKFKRETIFKTNVIENQLVTVDNKSDINVNIDPIVTENKTNDNSNQITKEIEIVPAIKGIEFKDMQTNDKPQLKDLIKDIDLYQNNIMIKPKFLSTDNEQSVTKLFFAAFNNINIEKTQYLEKAIRRAFMYSVDNEIIITEFPNGQVYRATVIGNRVYGLQFEAPYVIGDGTSNIRMLVQIKNKTESRGTGYTRSRQAIQLDISSEFYVTQFIRANKGDLFYLPKDIFAYIPSENEKIPLQRVGSAYNGGTAVDRSDYFESNPDFKNILISACYKLGLKVCAFDIVITSNRKELIIINVIPMPVIHYHPKIIYEAILRMICSTK